MQTVNFYVARFAASDNQFLFTAERQRHQKLRLCRLSSRIFLGNQTHVESNSLRTDIFRQFCQLSDGNRTLTGKTRALRRNQRRRIKTQNRSAHSELNFIVMIKRCRRGNTLFVDQSSIKTSVVVERKMTVMPPNFRVFAGNHRGGRFKNDITLRVAPENDNVVYDFERSRRRMSADKFKFGILRLILLICNVWRRISCRLNQLIP